ncbi:YopX family protein [Clostridium baratii]|uniref:YopX family protein n=1 Tax=Clostridium baratii TaxID=1561 RepID=UPI0030CB7C7B
MRENKFRAWDKEHNKMWFTGEEGERIGDWTFQTYFNKQGCLEAVILRCFYNGVGLENQDIKLPIMQDTGMRDKNGTKIYDGDIIKSYCELYKVVFNRTSFKIQNLNHPNANLFLFEYLNFDIAEVIGNIYENPELLKG